jgi:SSS family solute:Na+ symporter
MHLHAIDWAILAIYLVAMIAIGFKYAKRAESSVEEFFVSGRNLPWWLAGTSMVATTFSADTPLVIGGWVRDFGIWKNWAWWCYAVSGLITAFLFARYWRRLGVLTTAELAERRYGGREAGVLRGLFAFFQAGVYNVCVLAWVLLAAYKIMDVLFGVDRATAIAAACAITLFYSLLSGFWGVVVTDFVQFLVAISGAICLAVITWSEIGGAPAVRDAVAAGTVNGDLLHFLPRPGGESILDPAFFTPAVAMVCVYLGVSWWAAESVDGGSYIIQRIVACRNERHGMLAQLWYNVAHHALRPWPWILVAVASLLVFPSREVQAPVSGTVVHRSVEHLRIESDDGAIHEVKLAENEPIWRAVVLPEIATGAQKRVEAGQVIARTDSERAYPAMIAKYLPVGLLGLVLASLLAALMSTIDTHVILASSYVVNDLYRRFLVPVQSDKHYVFVGRIAGIAVMTLGALVAWQSESISALFFLATSLLAGIGPAYLLRWIWWRVRARAEIAALLTSSATTAFVEWNDDRLPLGPLLDSSGLVTAEGRLVVVAAASLLVALLVTWLSPKPDPKSLVTFYETVRPIGFWGPVRALTAARPRASELRFALTGAAASFVAIFGLLFGVGHWIFHEPSQAIAPLVLSGLSAFVASRCVRALTSDPGRPRAAGGAA